MPYEDMREKDLTPEMESSIARRRFGNRHDEPCRRLRGNDLFAVALPSSWLLPISLGRNRSERGGR